MVMSSNEGRYDAGHDPALATGWRLQRLTPVSRLFGANGICTGPDGRIYVAQVAGSQISAIDVGTGAIEVISAKGGDIVGPDDLVFSDEQDIYVTEFTEGRVSVRSANGQTRVLNDQIPAANPITMHQGRLFVGECRPDARLMELDRDTGRERVLLDKMPMLNAMEVGPDGLLYFPVMGANEIWRIDPNGGEPEVVARNLGVPDSVKFDSKGRIVSTQVGSGQVLRIDPRSGEKEVLADIGPGLDNVAFIGDRIFVSSIPGRVDELLGEGKVEPLIKDGFLWPLGLAVDAEGQLFVGDGPFSYTLQPGQPRQQAGMLFSPGSPGFVRGVASAGAGVFVVTAADGRVARWSPAMQESEILAEGFDKLMGVAIAADGTVVFAEQGGGRVLALKAGQVETLAVGLDQPSGVALSPDGAVFVAESGAGRVVRVSGGRAETVMDGLGQPQGLVAQGHLLHVLDALHKTVVEFDLSQKSQRVIASELPVGAPTGVIAKPLEAVPPLAGAMYPFAGLAVDMHGVLYVSADAEGSVIALYPPTEANLRSQGQA